MQKVNLQAIEWGPIGQQVYDRTYSRQNGDGRKETWLETVERVVNGNCDLVKDIHPVGDDEREFLKQMISSFKIMPAGRHLWVSGVPGRQFLFNCHRAGWDRRLKSHVQFLFEELMRGGGVGANYSQAGVYVPRRARVSFVCDDEHDDIDEIRHYLDAKLDPSTRSGIPIHRVEDSREGWTSALGALMDAHFQERHRGAIIFDVSKIRPKGSKIVSFGGTASGPKCLLDLLDDVHLHLNKREERVLSGLDLMHIDHLIARCVVAGNVRRSARMSIMHWEDIEIFDFINCKMDTSSHWTTNISVEIDDLFIDALKRGEAHARNVLDAISKGMARNGEPGIFNSSLASKGERKEVRCTNPCGEIALEEWENCNLGHLNLANLPTAYERYVAVTYMTRFLVRATLSPDVNWRQRSVLAKNRRIGVGIYGFQEWLINVFGAPYSSLLYDEKLRADVGRSLQQLRDKVKYEAATYAKKLGISTPIKHTTVAPTGTISALSGHSPGIHPIHAKYFIRRVRHADTDPLLQDIPEYRLETDEVSENTTIVKHLCADAIMDRVANRDQVQDATELTIQEQLAVQALVQEHWANNAVSYTVQLPKNPDVDAIKKGDRNLRKIVSKDSRCSPTKAFRNRPSSRSHARNSSRCPMNGTPNSNTPTTPNARTEPAPSDSILHRPTDAL